MTAPCMCDCGLTMADGELCLDWAAAGMTRTCRQADPVITSWGSRPEWQLLREQTRSWTNTTCRTHRVIAVYDVPYVRMKVGRGNAWYIRGMIDGAINAVPGADPDREPEMQWSTNWYLALPAGTDQEQTAPGNAEREYLVQPGDTLIVAYRMFGRTANYVQQTANRLEIATQQISLTAWPSKTTDGSGLTC